MKLYDGKIIQIMETKYPVKAIYYVMENKEIEKAFCHVMYLTSDGYVGYLGMTEDESWFDDPKKCDNFLGYEYFDKPRKWDEEIEKYLNRIAKEKK